MNKMNSYIRSSLIIVFTFGLFFGFQNCTSDVQPEELACGGCGEQPSIEDPALDNSANNRILVDDVAFYTFQKTAGSNEVSVTAPFGAWKGYVATTDNRMMSTGKRKQILEFEFSSPDYFTSANVGHFAIGIRGDALADANGDGNSDLQGRGVVIGNVSGYGFPFPAEGCVQSPSPNRVTIESYWAGNNCVYGATTSSPVLQNNKTYKLVLTTNLPKSGRAMIISYTLSERLNGGTWQTLQYHETTDSPRNTSNVNLAGWFIAEVFSTHSWTMNIRNLKTYQE